MRKIVITAAFALLAGVLAQGKITLPSVLSDNMVLQQQTQASVWGKAEPGKKVTVSTSWDKTKYTVVSDAQSGKWLVKVNTPEAGGPYTMTISDGESVTLSNILIGEVWFCSGQSNMFMLMKGYDSQPAKGAVDYITDAKASRPIRICDIMRKSSITELEESEGSWKENTPGTVANTSATAYFFADKLQSALGIPVGIITSSWGGSSIETWMRRDIIENEFPEFNISYLDGKSKPKTQHHDPCLLFNGQVAPLIPFTFKGMLWYQGETNRGKPDQYIKLQTAYVKMMRTLFQVPDAAFYFVQIAPYAYDNPDSFALGYFVEAQAKTLETIPHSGMAVTCDVGEKGTIHPCEKQTVGKRLAYLALQHDYGMDVIEADAPSYKSVEFKDGKALVNFNVSSLGLSPMGENLIEGFEIAGADKVFKKACATRTGNSTVTVYSLEVKDPVAVRYCFRNWCKGNLYNNFGIPAAPFRTDDWAL